jgi:tRNA A-37 threonylcarbamoyl transferase component Bud32
MSAVRTCPECGAGLPPDAPGGLCPRCLLGAGLGREAGSGGSTAAYRSGFEPPGPAELARHFPQLEVIELLGRGGMGAVYKARQPGLDRLVALKVLPPEAGLDPAFAERFAREARALARLSHPHIVTVFDFGRAGDFYYVTMEYVDGVDLRRALRAGELAPEQALAIVPQICDALQYAHDRGVVHRDIKPENILLDREGRVKVADFGLAKLLGQAAAAGPALTAPEQVMGTLHYMAPEQMEAPAAVDHRADIYSLGVVFYEMLTGRLPLGRFDPPSRRVRVDVRLDEVVLHALEREPRRRYQHAGDVKTDVEAIAGGPRGGPSRSLGGFAAATGKGPLPPGYGPRLLMLAISLVVSLLIMTAGLVLVGVAILTQPLGSGEFWGWIGGAFGCIFGGGGSLAGTWNTYRQMEGAVDLMSRPDWTGFDRVIVGYTLFGLIAAAAGVASSPWANWETVYSLLLLGGMMAVQGGIFLGIRLLQRRAAIQEAEARAGHVDE